MSKYIFETGGSTEGYEYNNTSQLHSFMDELLMQQALQYAPMEPNMQEGETVDEAEEFMQSLREREEDLEQDIDPEERTYSDMESYYNEELSKLEEANAYLEFMGSGEGADYINKRYSQESVGGYSSGGSGITTEGLGGTSGFFSGIFKNEGARTGQPTNLKSSALGRGQMIKGTRKAMYKKLGVTNIEEAEKRFRTDPNFEAQVMNAYKDELDRRIPSHIKGYDREYMLAKGWYTGDPFYPDNKVPGAEAGNKMTAGQYARRAVGSR